MFWFQGVGLYRMSRTRMGVCNGIHTEEHALAARVWQEKSRPEKERDVDKEKCLETLTVI